MSKEYDCKVNETFDRLNFLAFIILPIDFLFDEVLSAEKTSKSKSAETAAYQRLLRSDIFFRH